VQEPAVPPAARVRFIELLGISGVAITQPMLDVLGNNAELLITHQATAAEGVGLVLLAVLAVPVLALTVEALAKRLQSRLLPPTHAALIGLLAGVFVLEVSKRHSSLPSIALVLMAATAVPLVAASTLRFSGVGQFLRLLGAAPVVFALLFLFASPATDVLFDRGSGPSAAHAPSDQHVVVIVLDELPLASLLDGSGAIDRDLFPNFASLSDDSTWYRNTTTVAAFTQQAVPAILTGQLPEDKSALPIASDHPDNLFSLLNGAVEMNVHESATHLCSNSICGASNGHGFTALARASARLFVEFASPRRTREAFDDNLAVGVRLETARDFTESITFPPAGRLDFVHLELPHWPWRYISSLQDTGAEGELPGESYLQWPTAIGAQIGRQRHLLQMQATDTLLGRMIDRLRQLPDYDDALIVVTADHGVSFRAGEPVRNPSAANLNDIAWVPLFVKYPHQIEGRIDDRPAMTIDITPTIAAVFGVEPNEPFDGRSLLGAARDDAPRPLTAWPTFPTALDLNTDGGDQIEIDPDGFSAIVESIAAPEGGDPTLRIYRHSGYGGMIGMPSGSFTSVPASGQTAVIDDLDDFTAVERSAPSIPWAVNTGSVADASDHLALAIAINGRIVAVSETLPPVDGRAPFVFLVPPSLVREGSNDIAVYALSGLGPSTALRAIPLE
jgi:hypothetical protein